MKKKLKSIMLVDDNRTDNYFHKREIRKTNLAITVIEKNSALEALEYLRINKQNKAPNPDLLFLDINMPCMNGWEFLKEYSRLDEDLQREVMIIMLTTSGNPDNIARAKALNIVADFITKPLTKEILEEINKKYFEV
jgi:CheY-like chemotaxis protein